MSSLRCSLRCLCIVCLAALAGVGCFSLPAHALDLPKVFNTGVSDTGSLLPDGASDPHYILIASDDPAHTGPGAFVVNETGYPIGSNWMPDGPASKWIAPQADQNDHAGQGPGGDKPGSYTYRTTLDLTGIDPASLKIDGQWSTDDFGLDILVNGHSTGITDYGPGGVGMSGYGDFVPFTLDRFFVPGVNTLDFLMANASPPGGNLFNPSAIRIELSASATGTPEPGSLLLLAAGSVFFGLGAFRGRRCRRRDGQ